jgi:hypothetical protein
MILRLCLQLQWRQGPVKAEEPHISKDGRKVATIHSPDTQPDKNYDGFGITVVLVFCLFWGFVLFFCSTGV